jgi:hypothetical protein
MPLYLDYTILREPQQHPPVHDFSRYNRENPHFKPIFHAFAQFLLQINKFLIASLNVL